MAKEKGFYDAVGLDVSIKEFDFGVNIEEDVTQRVSDFGVGRSSLVLDRLEGSEVVLLQATLQESPYVLMSKKRADLRSVKDFKYKKIMLSDDLSSLAAIYSMMRIENITTKDYTEIPHSFNIDDLIQNKVDLVTTYTSNEPYHLEEKGIEYSLFNPKDYGFNFYSDILFTSQEYLKNNPENVKKFQEATKRGFLYAYKNKEETINLILDKYNTQNKSFEALLYEAEVLEKLAFKDDVEFGFISETRVQEIANVYKLLGMSKNSNDALKNFIYREENLVESIKSFFTLELLLGISGLVLLIIFLSVYKQYILKRQNHFLEDIVEEKTKELREANKDLEKKVQLRTLDLEHAIQVKSDFLANMSHEIRTPLNGIIGFVDILYKEEHDDAKKHKLEIIKESSNSLLTIINDILDFSKLEADKVLIESIPIKLKNIFTNTVELYSGKASEKDVSLRLNIESGFPDVIYGDSTRIRQVFLNILNNAVKFSDNGSEVIVNLKYKELNATFTCEVIDSGIGMSKENLKNIFNSFEQADSSVNRTHGGTGLGLSISKALVDRVDGEFEVSSQEGEGSIFSFSLPAKLAELQTIENEIAVDEQNELQGKVLIVEDNKTNQMLLSMLLDDYNLEYDIANDGLEAVEYVQKNFYKIVLMDENMPNMSGIQATEKIRSLKEYENLTIIAVTANALDGDKERFLKAGMNDYLSKPIDVNKLEFILEKYLLI